MRSCSQLQLHLKSFLPLRFDAYEVLFRDDLYHHLPSIPFMPKSMQWGRQLIYNLNFAKSLQVAFKFSAAVEWVNFTFMQMTLQTPTHTHTHTHTYTESRFRCHSQSFYSSSAYYAYAQWCWSSISFWQCHCNVSYSLGSSHYGLWLWLLVRVSWA